MTGSARPAPPPIGQGRDALGEILAWFAASEKALLAGLVTALVLVAILVAVRSLGARFDRGGQRAGTGVILARVAARTSSLFLVMLAAAIIASFADPPRRLARIVDILFIVAAAFQGAVWARELILGLIGRKVGEDDRESMLANAMAIIRVLVSITLFAIALVVVLDNLGVNVTALIAGLGIGGIAIGLAAQGIFSDLFAALAILFDRPFRRGDLIRYDNSIGTVERIGLKTTRLRSLSGEQLIMANTKLLEREIHNLTGGEMRRQTLNFGLTYQTGTDALARVEPLAREAVEAISGCNLLRCVMTGFGASALEFELAYDDRNLGQDELARNRSAIILALLDRLREADIAFAYPTQTSFTAAPDGRLVMPYAPPAAPANSDG